MFKTTLRNLASLSLVDYKWRSALFKKNEADRMEEEWMATMMGEDPTYARPMDADDQRRGPLVCLILFSKQNMCVSVLRYSFLITIHLNQPTITG